MPLALSLAIAIYLRRTRPGQDESHSLLPAFLLDRAAAALASAGVGGRYSPERVGFAACSCAAAASLVGVFVAWGSPLVVVIAPVLALAGGVLPFRLLAAGAERRRGQILRELPDVMDLLAICVGSGMALDPALRLAADRFPGVTSAELRAMFAEIDLGARRADAYRSLAERLGTPEARVLAAALVRADGLGLPLGATLTEQAEALRAARERLVRERAEKAAPRVQLVVALVMVPGAMILVLGALLLELIDRLAALGVTG